MTGAPKDLQKSERLGFFKGGSAMDKYKIGELVYANLGTLPVVGTVVDCNEKLGKYLVRFSAVQQDWYAEEALPPFSPGADT